MFTRRQMIGGAATVVAAPAVFAQERALVFEHIFGETRLTRPAKRVASLGYTSHDALLALGITPLCVRHWYGAHPNGIWPWAQDRVGEDPPLELFGEISAETLAALEPDLIIGLGSGISEAEYALFSQIAPVLMHKPEFGAYATPWREGLRMLSRAVDRVERAESVIADVDTGFERLRHAHPDWSKNTAAVGWHFGGQTGIFSKDDSRTQFLMELGFQTAPGLADLNAIDGFYATLSPEDLSLLDTDVLLWISTWDENPDLVDLPMRRTLAAHREGREVFSDHVLSGALSFNSALSIPYAIERLEPELIAALDGTPETIVPSSQKAGLTK
ncbi:MAG: ABC transporter substrate-binding protein [Pseudomonadota bacterium]